MKKKTKLKTMKGITLIALIITIAILIIITAVSISAFSDSGLIGKAKNARKEYSIQSEIGQIQNAIFSAFLTTTGEITEEELNSALRATFIDGYSLAYFEEEGFYAVTIKATNREYEITKDGQVKYLGDCNELIKNITLVASVKENKTPKLVHDINFTIKSDFAANIKLNYAWVTNENENPEEETYKEANLSGTSKEKVATISTEGTDAVDYYLNVKLLVNGNLIKEEKYGPFTVKDHTTLKIQSSGFLGISTDLIEREKVKTINIYNTLNEYNVWRNNGGTVYDITQDNKGKYWAWFETDLNGYYTVYMAGENGIVANANSVSLFENVGRNIQNEEVKINGLEYLDTGLVTSMYRMFKGSSFEKLNFSFFNTENVTIMYQMFCATKLVELDLTSFNTDNVLSTYEMFRDSSNLIKIDVSNFTLKKATNISRMFWGCSKLEALDLSNFNTSNVNSISGIFCGCRKLTSIDLSSFDTINIIDTSSMFQNCTELVYINFNNFNTNKVTTMNSMFVNCFKLTSIDLGGFDTSNVINMSGMFKGCNNLVNVNLSKFNTSKVTNMWGMFCDCSKLNNLDLTNFDMTNITSYDAFIVRANPSNLTIKGNENVYNFININFPNYASCVQY